VTTNNVSDAELEIMRIIWNKNGRVYLSDLMEVLSKMGKKWKTNTVLTFLSRLAEKKMLKIEKKGRINQYIALLTEEVYTQTLTQSFLGKFFGGDAKNLVAALLRQDCLSGEDIAELQEFWKENGDRRE
jgi:BlaI family penicillinase repressor